MNLELNVVRFENEDVIATSCDHDGAHFIFTGYKCFVDESLIGHGPQNQILYATYNGSGEYMCTEPDKITKKGIELNVWYHLDESNNYVKCDYNGTKPSENDWMIGSISHTSY